ncbi:hypothetical protein ACL02T_15675 [Pseudonocardia sp. RS010]|uniref:hypothetical protein n=1 Tax=Pseudonocardia sp. RS010 TaxID=3385979 RepID=UPI00399F0A37
MTSVARADSDTTGVVPLERQLIKGAHMMIIAYRPADPGAVRAALPEQLEPHDDGCVLLNLWVAPHPGTSSGFGEYSPLSCGYLAAEVNGWDSTMPGGGVAHGRYFAQHWLGHDGMRAYAEASCGNVADVGHVTYTEPEPGRLVAELHVDDTVRIRVRASVGMDTLDTAGGHLNYFTSRAGDGGSEVARIRVPFVADLLAAQVDSIEWLFPSDHPAARLAPADPLDVRDVLYGYVSWVPFTVAEVL